MFLVRDVLPFMCVAKMIDGLADRSERDPRKPRHVPRPKSVKSLGEIRRPGATGPLDVIAEIAVLSSGRSGSYLVHAIFKLVAKSPRHKIFVRLDGRHRTHLHDRCCEFDAEPRTEPRTPN
jgi:hypothetical protein